MVPAVVRGGGWGLVCVRCAPMAIVQSILYTVPPVLMQNCCAFTNIFSSCTAGAHVKCLVGFRHGCLGIRAIVLATLIIPSTLSSTWIYLRYLRMCPATAMSEKNRNTYFDGYVV